MQNDFTCLSKRLRFVSKRLVSKRPYHTHSNSVFQNEDVLVTAFFFMTTILNPLTLVWVLLFFMYLPKMRRDEVELSLLALFVAVHLYVPSMYFVTFWRSSWYPSLVCFSIASEGRLRSLNVQVIAGFGKPVALQISLAVLPSGIDWFLGDTVIWRETLGSNIFHLAVFLVPNLCSATMTRIESNCPF